MGGYGGGGGGPTYLWHSATSLFLYTQWDDVNLIWKMQEVWCGYLLKKQLVYLMKMKAQIL